MNKDLETIKKKYGESMAHLCRELFPNLLEKEGVLPEILQDNFAVSKNLCSDLKENKCTNSFQGYLLNRANIEYNKPDTNESPWALMEKAGYKLYECITQAEIDSFKKYYDEDEQLCTFHDPDRLKSNYVFFAVKKNVNEIKRKDFKNPQREDAYGTSVISIQFSRGKNNITSIKNRYNHTVQNPDATFHNDLENIIPGLTSSFEKQFGLHIGSYEKRFSMDHYEQAKDNRFYRFNNFINGVHYCENNILLDDDNVVREYNVPEKYLFMDNYILDLSKKKIIKYKDENSDGFIDNLDGMQKIDITRDKKTGTKKIVIKKANNEDVEITLNKNNNIIKYKDSNLVDAGDNFMRYCVKLEEFDCPNLKKAGPKLLSRNRKLKEFNAPLLEEVPDGCLEMNEDLTKVDIRSATRIGDNFLNYNKELLELDAPNAIEIGRGLLDWNRKIENVNIPKVKKIDSNFINMSENVKINGSNEVLKLDVEEIGDGFLSNHLTIKEVYLKKLKTVGAGFINRNRIIEKIDVRNLENIGSSFLSSNRNLLDIDLGNATEIGDDFLQNNVILEKINVKNAEVVGNRFLKSNEGLRKLDISNLKEHGYEFIPNNRKVKIQADNLSFKDRFYTNHIRKIKRTFQIIRKLSIYNRDAIKYNQAVVRGYYDGMMDNGYDDDDDDDYEMLDDADREYFDRMDRLFHRDEHQDNENDNENGRWI